MAYETPRFNADSEVLSSNPYPQPNQPNSVILIPVSLRSIAILSCYIRLGVARGLFPVGFSIKIPYLSYIKTGISVS